MKVELTRGAEAATLGSSSRGPKQEGVGYELGPDVESPADGEGPARSGRFGFFLLDGDLLASSDYSKNDRWTAVKLVVHDRMRWPSTSTPRRAAGALVIFRDMRIARYSKSAAVLLVRVSSTEATRAANLLRACRRS